MIETYELYIQVGVFVIMYLFGLYLLKYEKKLISIIVYTLTYFSCSYTGYLINGKKGLIIAAEVVLIAMLLYVRHVYNKRINAALKRLEEKERTAKEEDSGDKK